MPRNSLEKLGGDWLPPAAEDAVLEHVQMVNITKVYASYADAWWANHLGLVEGFFNKTNLFKGAPLHGRYHDGPIKCVIGEDDSGNPVYSGDRVRFGNCSGAIEAYYTRTENGKIVDELHASLMDFHAEALRAAGVDPASIAKPELVTVSDWSGDATVTPACGDFIGDADTAKAARRPDPARGVFLANQDFGPQFCWATGSLIVAERVLMDLGVSKPAWLNATWYADRVASMP
ncbi:hypothetical protein JL722_2239 [Aureococcus anophagefferens]|nr:hypothetical protein JL722_2239 [Aureococcus anophagefferens]